MEFLPVASSNGPWDSDNFLTSSLNSAPPAFSSTDPRKQKSGVHLSLFGQVYIEFMFK